MNFGCQALGCHSKHYAKTFCKIHFLRWKRHGDPFKRLRNGNGEGSVSKQGYFLETIRGKQKLAHVNIAEKILGRKLKKGELVHHADGNKSNNSNDNLVICKNNSYHMLLHRRIRALNDCGNTDWRRCVFCKKYDDINKLYINNRSCFHRKCHNSYKRKQKKDKHDNS